MQSAPAHAGPAQGSHYLRAELAQRAVALAAPMLEQALADREVVGSGFLYLVVMDPGRAPGEGRFEDAVLHEQAFGDRSHWDADYASFAREKARLSWRTGHDGRVVQECLPHLLRTGDTVLAGTVALCLRALTRRAREAETAGVSLGEAPQS